MKPIKIPFQDYNPDSPEYWSEGAGTVQNCLPTLASPNYSSQNSIVLSAIGPISQSAYNANAFSYSNGAGLSSTSLSISNGKSGSLSFWFRIDSSFTNGGLLVFSGSGSSFFQIAINSSGQLDISGTNAAGSGILHVHTAQTFSPGVAWHNCLASWNLATGAINLFIDGSSDNVTVINTNDTLAYVETNYRLNGVGNIYSQAEFWFDTSFVDFSISANRLLFRTSGGLPVNLGSTGQIPTGSSPKIYLNSQASQAGNNSGVGGNFTIIPTISIASTSPSSGSGPTTIYSQFLGAISVIDANGLSHTYAGTSNNLAEITATAANNVSLSFGGYNCGTYWKFSQLAQTIYATDYADNVQSMTIGGTAFANLAGSPPKAQCIAQGNQQILLGNTNGGTYNGATAGAVPNRVWGCAIGNPASWPDPLTNAGQAAQAFVQDMPPQYGAVQHITDGIFNVLVFQQNGISLATYAGAPVVWTFNDYEKKIGLYCPNAVVKVGEGFASTYYFPHSSGFYMTNGYVTEPVGHNLVDKTWLADVDTAYLSHVRGTLDQQNKIISWAYKSVSQPLVGGFVICDKVIAYNYINKRWGMAMVGQSIDIWYSALTLPYTMEQLDSVNSNLDLISPSLDDPYWNGGNPAIGVFGIQQIGSSGSYASYAGTVNGTPLTATLDTKVSNFNLGGRSFSSQFKPIVMGTSTPSNADAVFNTAPLSNALITWTDSTYINPQAMATGDGATTTFYFKISNLFYTPTNPLIYVNDWEGNQLQYTTSRTNLGTYSQDASHWGVTGVTITNNLSGAPDGSATLNKILQDSSNGIHHGVTPCDTSSNSLGIYTGRWIVSAGNATYFQAALSDQATGNANAVFSFLTNTIISTGTSGSWTNSSFKSYSIGSGFYSIEITSTKGDATQACAMNYNHYNGTTNSFAGDGATYFYAWGSMLQTGSTVGSYIKTAGAIASHTDYTYNPPAIVATSITGQVGTQKLLTDAVTWSASVSPEARTGKCSLRTDAVYKRYRVNIANGFTNAMGVEVEEQPSGQA